MSDKQPPSHQRHHTKLKILVVVLASVALWGIFSRIEAATSLKKKTGEQAVQIVNVIKAPQGPLSEDVVLPGNIQAWHEAPIFARTSGYLKDWLTDIGAHVKTGDLLAEIETPEVDAQLHQAEADLATAEANNQLAQTTADRWQALFKTNSVSKQDLDNKTGAAAAAAATVASGRANLDRLRQMEDFKRVTAPFDGIITARNTDTGALINAGSSGTGPELFHIAETDKLRVYVEVPEIYTLAVTPNMTAELHFTEHPQQTYTATLIQSADAIDPATRTLQIELEIDNDKGELLPGSYAEVHIKLPTSNDSVHLPVTTLLFRASGLQVATVDKDSKVQLKTITIGRDYGKEVEVISGVAPDEMVVINPSDSVTDGQEVRVVTPEQKQPDGGKTKSDDKNKKDDDGKKL